MIRVARKGTRFFGTATDLERVQEEYKQNHCVVIRHFLEEGLLADIRGRMDFASFSPRVDEGIATELCLEDPLTLSILTLVLNNQELFDFTQKITGCGRIGSFSGRAYLFHAKFGHYDSWHDDLIDDRLVALSINLSSGAYEGGLLQIRERSSKRVTFEYANTGFGDALIFQVASNLQHRITEVMGETPKIAFAGWFKSQPDFLTLFKNNTVQ
ncbi:MAG: 2OG-Fe(II) oxygenase [Pyrinomonadaceae bacterium]